MFKHGECLVPQRNHGSMGVSMGNHSNNDSDGNHTNASNDETTSKKVLCQSGNIIESKIIM